MANWSRPSIIEELVIDDENLGEVDLSGGFLEFEYFESLFSPHITASLMYIDTGNSVKGQEDVQQRIGTIYTGISDFKGKKVKLKFNHESAPTTGLEFDTYPLEIIKSVTIAEKDKKKSYGFKLASEYASKNENTNVYEKYYNSISDSVQKILVDKLGVPTERIFKDKTKNSEAFQGFGERPFDLITILARMSIPETGSPGYFFYETIDGFNFKSIDKLLKADVKGTAAYIYSDVGTYCNASNFRILNYDPPQETDFLSQIRSGVYDTELITFDVSTFTFKREELKLSEKIQPTVGSNELPESNQSSDKNQHGRTIFNIVDSGNNEAGISTNINNDPKDWVSSILRYNSLMFHSCSIVVPCNLELRAGDLITCEFPKLTQDPSQGVSDEKISGKYLILHLSHKFTSNGQTGSTTHITMVRDTHGAYSPIGGE